MSYFKDNRELFFRVKNWDSYQHYKDRSPPWVKLHNSILDDYQFSILPDETKYHFVASMLLASRTNNMIPTDSAWIAKMVSSQSNMDICTLIDKRFLEVCTADGNIVCPLNTGIYEYFKRIYESNASNMLQDASKPLAFARSQEERRGEEKKHPVQGKVISLAGGDS